MKMELDSLDMFKCDGATVSSVAMSTSTASTTLLSEPSVHVEDTQLSFAV